MSYEIQTYSEFDRNLKKLTKRYRSIANDYKFFLDSLRENPFQGTELCPNIRKVRMAITTKGRGKSGGARVITATAIVNQYEGKIILLTIYDKADTSNVDIRIIKQIAQNLGIDISQ